MTVIYNQGLVIQTFDVVIALGTSITTVTAGFLRSRFLGATAVFAGSPTGDGESDAGIRSNVTGLAYAYGDAMTGFQLAIGAAATADRTFHVVIFSRV